MATCSEPLVWTCKACGHSFHEKEWVKAGRKCPACERTAGNWKCSLCQEAFNQPALSPKHPCRRDSSYASFQKVENDSVPRKEKQRNLPALSINTKTLAIAGSLLVALMVTMFFVGQSMQTSVSKGSSSQNQVPTPPKTSGSPGTQQGFSKDEFSQSKGQTPALQNESEQTQGNTAMDREEIFRSNYIKAAQAFSRNDFEDSLDFLNRAEAAKPSQASTANLRGAIYTRKREWAKAQASFEEALRLQPDLPMAEFNLGEIHFLNREYREARQRFRAFLKSQPDNDLAQYKIFLCDLFGGNPSSANAFLETLQPSSSSPIYYFCKAAQAFTLGNRHEGMEFVNSAYRIYPADANATFADSLVEKGYLQGQSP
jgi:tetratricopeptide (TPR) repeat protein